MTEEKNDLVNIHFDDNRKRQGLVTSDLDDDVTKVAGEDKSRKGSVDQRIISLVNFINSRDNLFTTSSCSGRSILFTHDSGESSSSETKSKKRGCKWLHVTHDVLIEDEFIEAWKSNCSIYKDICFKVEPCILHIQCRKLSDAKKLIHCATESGFRNSGMVVGKDNKMTVAVRSAIGLEVPLCESVSTEFLKYLVSKANEKMTENWERSEKFTEEIMKVVL